MFHRPVPLGPDAAAATETYARRFSGDVGAWMLGLQTQTIDTFLADWAEGSVLDVGGGHCQLTPHLLEQGREVTTLVSSVEAAARVRQLTDDRASCLLGDVEALSLADRSFDVVVALRMMAHVADWRSFLASLCRVARRGVIVDYPLAGGMNALSPLLFRVKRSIEGDTRPYASFRRDDVEREFAAEGLVLDRQVGEFVVPMGLHRMMRTRAISQGLEAVLHPLAVRIGNPVLVRASR